MCHCKFCLCHVRKGILTDAVLQAQECALANFTTSFKASKSWYDAFMARHPDIKEKLTTNMEIKRMQALSPERIRDFHKGYVSVALVLSEGLDVF